MLLPETLLIVKIKIFYGFHVVLVYRLEYYMNTVGIYIVDR